MSAEPIQYPDLVNLVYNRLKDMVLSGEFKAGERIPQEKVAEMLGVSRTPLHKAFQMLEDEFLVESIPRRGIFVKKPDFVSIMEAFECREGLEGIAARRAALQMEDEEMDYLEGLFSSFTSIEDIDKIEYQKADHALHDTIIRSSGNKVLQKLNSMGNVLIKTYPRGIILPIEESMKDHKLIIQALRDRKPDRAELLVREHSRKARNILEQLINEQKK